MGVQPLCGCADLGVVPAVAGYIPASIGFRQVPFDGTVRAVCFVDDDPFLATTATRHRRTPPVGCGCRGTLPATYGHTPASRNTGSTHRVRPAVPPGTLSLPSSDQSCGPPSTDAAIVFFGGCYERPVHALAVRQSPECRQPPYLDQGSYVQLPTSTPRSLVVRPARTVSEPQGFQLSL